MNAAGRRRRYALLVGAVFAVALAARLGTLHWSPLPSTLDGFLYVWRAQETIQTGAFPLDRFRADSFVFTTLVTTAGLITGEQPLHVIQPVVAITGGASCLTALALARRLGWRLGWDPGRTALTAGIAGFGLAVSGFYVRRSGTADEEALAFLLVPLFAIAVHRLFTRDRRTGRWLAVSALFFVTFPLLHTFSSLVAGLVVTGILGAYLASVPSRRGVAAAGLLIAGFWTYLWGYYEVAERLGLFVPYVNRVTAYPGLFLAWLIVLTVGVAWLQRSGATPQRAGIGTAIGLWFVALAANVGQSVFPGTQTTPTLLLVAVAAFAVPFLFALVGLPAVSWERDESGPVVLGLLLGPIVVVYFSLTAALTPEYFDTAMRGHVFVYFPVFVLAAVGVGTLAVRGRRHGTEAASEAGTPVASDGGTGRSRGTTVALVAIVLVSALVTLPVAFVHLDTLDAPAVTTESEFAAVTFTAQRSTGPWATDHSLSRVAVHTYPDAPKASYQPVVAWLQGGEQPECPTLAQDTWATSGAHLFPAPAERTSPRAYESWQSRNEVVYSTAGLDATVLVRPRSVGTNESGCYSNN
ncbi:MULTISPECIES: sodium:phosphate symporter [Halomicrobium]|uniref:Sodium:phosphate symporter n=2 Tax=Halomicrobium mukohataei TaxID=57705 RepID=A0A4D6KFF9_9EURY|nr:MULTISPECIES: sodium:phosphate symporter [Halomicrobium]ACV46207.1 putative sodium/phosphate symporter [Halomicrobium mukohataei DSM 12286]QCD64771.1 sodium:phosphate symporter [Halomicrobium mukohataei]QFR19578.1 sodium:phosphate symporter [Halomicrobium sp. ZPS1]